MLDGGVESGNEEWLDIGEECDTFVTALGKILSRMSSALGLKDEKG